MNSYELSRAFFDWCFANPEKVKPNHVALYFFAIEHCNRLGWKTKFGLPTTMTKEAIGIKSYNTYINALNDLVEWGFIELVERSKNQYSSNIIALSNFNKAHDKALDKALIKHGSKQSESIGSIDKPLTSNNKPLTNIDTRKAKFVLDCSKENTEKNIIPNADLIAPPGDYRNTFTNYWTAIKPNGRKMRFEKEQIFDIPRRLHTWSLNLKNRNNQQHGGSAKEDHQRVHDELGGSTISPGGN